MNTIKSFKAWLVYDSANIYVPSLHMTRTDAMIEMRRHSYIEDANFCVERVTVNPYIRKTVKR